MQRQYDLIVPVFVIITWIIIGFYFAIGGLNRIDTNDKLKQIESRKIDLQKDTVNRVIDDVELTTRYDLEKFREIKNQPEAFKWFYSLNNLVGVLIASCAFGLLGAIIELIRKIVFDGKQIKELNYFSMPLLGLLSGIAVLGLTYLLPSLLVVDGKEIRPQTLIFLCLFGGLHSNALFVKLHTYFTKIFS